MLRRAAPLLFLPLLAGCVNDGAAYMIENRNHALSVVREQNFFWEKKVQLAVVVSRLPDCQRKHPMQLANPSTPIELWQPGPGTFILKVGKNMYVTETRTCQGFAKMEEDPPGGYGPQLGTFTLKGDVFTFVPAPKPEGGEAGAGR